MSDEKKNAIDVMLTMRQSAVERFNDRRNLEWKLTTTLWGGIALAANALRDETLNKWLVLVSGAIIVALHSAWEVNYVVPGARNDRDEGIDWSERVYEAMWVPWKKRAKYRPIFAHYWQVLITALLVLVIFAVTR